MIRLKLSCGWLEPAFVNYWLHTWPVIYLSSIDTWNNAWVQYHAEHAWLKLRHASCAGHCPTYLWSCACQLFWFRSIGSAVNVLWCFYFMLSFLDNSFLDLCLWVIWRNGSHIICSQNVTRASGVELLHDQGFPQVDVTGCIANSLQIPLESFFSPFPSHESKFSKGPLLILRVWKGQEMFSAIQVLLYTSSLVKSS